MPCSLDNYSPYSLGLQLLVIPVSLSLLGTEQPEGPCLKQSPKITVASASENMEKPTLSFTAGGDVKWCCHFRKYAGSSSKVTELPDNPSVPLLCIYLGEMKACSNTNTCIWMFIAALFTKAPKWKWPKCSSTDKWINYMWSIQTMDYHLGIKRNAVLTCATTWINFETLW